MRSKAQEPRAALFELLEPRTLLSTVIVNSTDYQTSPPGNGIVTLLDALSTAAAASDSTTINFDPAVFATRQTISSFPGVDITGSSPIIINGPASGLTIISGGPSLKIESGTTVTVSNWIMTGGFTFAGAGGVDNAGTLKLNTCTINANNSGSAGTIQSPGHGAGINNTGTLTLVNCTVSNNVDTDANATGGYSPPYVSFGGGLLNSGTATLINDTFANNYASVGPSIDNSGTLTIGNTILFSGSSTIPDVDGSVTSLGHNYVNIAVPSNGWLSSDQTGTAGHPIYPELGTLSENGGPVPTIVPYEASFAIDNGDLQLLPSDISTDARELPRVVNGIVDIGAVEVQNSATGTRPAPMSLQTSANTVASGSPVTLYAVVNPTTQAATTGRFVFSDNGLLLQTVTVDFSGHATLTVSTLPTGENSIVASYTGDPNYAPAKTDPAVVKVGEEVALALPPVVSHIPADLVKTVKVNRGIIARLSNPFDSVFADKVTLSLIAKPTGSAASSASYTLVFVAQKLRVKASRSTYVSLKVRSLPDNIPAGAYELLVQTLDTAGHTNFADLNQIATVEEPVVLLSANFAAAPNFDINKPVKIELTNAGNIPENSKLTAIIGISTNANGSDPIATGTGKITPDRVRIAPLIKKATLRATGWKSLASFVAGLSSYYLTAMITDAAGNSTTCVSQYIPGM